MMKQFLLFTLLLLVSCVILLVSCNKSINIVSDESDVVFIAEAYNNYKNKDKIFVYTTSDIPKIIEENQVDFIITKSETDEFLFDEMRFSKIKNSKREINRKKDNFKLISFSLPLVVIKKEIDEKDFRSSTISLFDLQNIQRITMLGNDGIYSIVFYPIEQSFSHVFETPQQEKDWLSQAGLDTEEINIYFKNHYGPVPISARLLDDHISYKYISSDIFFALPHSIQSQFNIYLLRGLSDKIPPIHPVYIARQANGIHGFFQEKRFLSWLFSEKGQKRIVEYMQNYYNKSVHSFIGATLSALWDVNTSVLFNQNRWLFVHQPLLSQIEND